MELPDAAAKQDYSHIARTLGKTANQKLAVHLTRALEIDGRHVVLDAGCGTGGEAKVIEECSGARVVGVDRSSGMLRLAGDLRARIRGDVEQLAMRPASVDAAYSINVLQILGDRQAFLRELRRVVRFGGRIALPVTSPDELRSRFVNRFFPSLPSLELGRYPTPELLRQELRSAGFREVERTRVDMGDFQVDPAYVARLRSGIFSGLNWLPAAERERGFRELEAWVARACESGPGPLVSRWRTLLAAR